MEDKLADDKSHERQTQNGHIFSNTEVTGGLTENFGVVVGWDESPIGGEKLEERD